jgi:hypothetical protein
LLRTLNTLFLAGIFATLVLILFHIQEPLSVRGAVQAEIDEPLNVEIDNQPVEVEVLR